MNGPKYCHECGRDFANAKAFDEHRIGSLMPRRQRCLSGIEMAARGYDVDSNGRWFDAEKAKRVRGGFSNAS